MLTFAQGTAESLGTLTVLKTVVATMTRIKVFIKGSFGVGCVSKAKFAVASIIAMGFAFTIRSRRNM